MTPTANETTETLTCPRSHEVEVTWSDGQKAEEWICPPCRETKLAELRAVARDPEAYRDAAAAAEQYARVAFTQGSTK